MVLYSSKNPSLSTLIDKLESLKAHVLHAKLCQMMI
jgi:hypothetical protein